MKINIYKKINNIFHKYRSLSQENIDYENAKMILKNDNDAILLDVRSPQEYKEGHLNQSINISLYDIEKQCTQVLKNKENAIIVYCQTGNRSKKAKEILRKKGYVNLYNIIGGLDNIENL